MKAKILLLIILAVSMLWISCERDYLNAEDKTVEQNLKAEPGNPPPGGGICDFTIANQTAKNCELATYVAADSSNMYSVRDSIFSFSTNGQEYISYYYTISEFIQENGIYGSCEIFEQDFHQAHIDGFIMITNYLNPFYSDTLISDALYFQLMDFSSELKGYDSSNEITGILEDLESDLNYLRNKPASDVRDFFNY